jgi:hypothetical protein
MASRRKAIEAWRRARRELPNRKKGGANGQGQKERRTALDFEATTGDVHRLPEQTKE